MNAQGNHAGAGPGDALATQAVRGKPRGARSALVDLCRIKPIGKAAAALARLIGSGEISRKISVLCDYVPSVVDVQIPAQIADGRFRMGGADCRDPVSRDLWWKGGLKYESPFPEIFAACSLGSRCVLDVGSFSGLYSLIAATCSPTSRVFAFEPFPVARASSRTTSG